MKFKRRILLKFGAAYYFNSLLKNPLYAHSVKNLTKPPKVKIALLGLGNYAENWIAPAIAQSEYAVLTSLITGSPDKIPKWKKRYQIKDENIYNYENLDHIIKNDYIDCVYIVTPTGTHSDFTIRSLKAKKHVICEKPMASTVAECDQMISVAKSANKSLQIGYRLYWDPFNICLMEAMRTKKFGKLEGMQGDFSYNQGSFHNKGKNDWRMNPKLNPGGALFDIGVYVAQSAFYSSQMHPISVTANHITNRPDIFKDIPEHWEWELTWPNNMKSQHYASYGRQANYIRLKTEKGRVEINPAYSYEGLKGSTPNGKMKYKNIFQQKLQIDGQCLAIRNRRANITSGEMGRRDVLLLNQIMKAADTRTPIVLNDLFV